MWLFEGAEGGKWVEDLEKKYRGSQSRSQSRASSRPATPAQAAVHANGHTADELSRLAKKQRLQ